MPKKEIIMQRVVLSAPKWVTELIPHKELREIFKKAYEKEYRKRVK